MHAQMETGEVVLQPYGYCRGRRAGSCITRSSWSSTCRATGPVRRRIGRRRMRQTGKT